MKIIPKKKLDQIDIPKYFYEVVFDKPGGLVMPIIIDIKYEDGETVEKNIRHKFGEKMIMK